MDRNAISRCFAELRLSRRRAVTQGGAGIAGALIATGLGQTSSLAQGATPVAGGDVEFLYVQSFGSGSIAPAGDDGAYTLTLGQGLGETVYFSDRPGRMVGTVSSSDFISVFDTTSDDPPNAALVSGDTIFVVELTTARWDEASGTLTYDATPIGEDDVQLSFEHAIGALPDGEMPLDTCHLFIDSIDQCCDPIHRPWCC